MVEVKFELPRFSAGQAVRLTEQRYGLRATAVPLPSERDQNFLLTTDAGERFVLKISNRGEQREILELQNEVLKHLAKRAPQLSFPQVRRTLQGESLFDLAGAEGATHFVRLLSYVPGRVWAKVNPHTPELLRSLGRVMGTLDQALQDFAHPAARRELKWDLARAGWIREYLPHIIDDTRRTIVESFLELYERSVKPRLDALPVSVIYNDANDYNVLVDEGDPWTRRVIGVIDFGDMVYGQRVCDLAIAAAYAIMDKPDPISAAAEVVTGYHEICPIEETELEILFPLICARLCVTVTNAAYQRRVEPTNVYLTVSERPAWELLGKLACVPAPLAHYIFRHACGMPACPATRALTGWLQAHASEMGSVFEENLGASSSVVVDMSVGSLELGGNSNFSDVRRFTRTVFDRMESAGAAIGIGRYGEARACYSSDIFRVEGNCGPEWRTVHLGIDLFVQPGTPVFAPLDGFVHSFRNNAGHLDYGPTIILRHACTGEGGQEQTFYTLYGHLSPESLDGLSEGMPISRGARIGSIGTHLVNGNWPPHLHFQIIADMLGRTGEFAGVALPAQREVWQSLCPDPNLILRLRATYEAAPQMSTPGLTKRRRETIGPNLSVSYREPLQIVRGYMQYLYDESGRAYLDAVNNVPHVGHCHPRVVEAGQRQMAVLCTNSRYLHENLVRYAERLCAKLPEPLRVCYFVNSGSEANELALRLARARTGTMETIVVDVAYHGNTTGLIEISPYKHAGPGGSGAPPHVHTVPLPDTYRGAYRRDDPHAGAHYAQSVLDVTDRLRRKGGGAATFIAESILSCGGQIVLPDGYLRDAYRHVRAAGGVTIADEVQVGFGRPGTHFWAFETQGVVPDIVTLGKPIGNGHPLAAVITTPEIARAFDNGMEYFSTFGGNAVSCAIGMAVLDVIESERLQENALAVGSRLIDGLRNLMSRHPIIGDVRGLGLFIGVELVLDRGTREPAGVQAAYVANRMKERSILISTDGPFHNVLKIKPPLVFTRENADFLVASLDKVLKEDFALV